MYCIHYCVSKSSVPPIVTTSYRCSCRRSARCRVLQRSYCAVRETNAHVLSDHVSRQKLLESHHAIPRSAVKRIAHGPGVRITRVDDAAVARSVVASLSVRRRVRHLYYNNIIYVTRIMRSPKAIIATAMCRYTLYD